MDTHAMNVRVCFVSKRVIHSSQGHTNGPCCRPAKPNDHALLSLSVESSLSSPTECVRCCPCMGVHTCATTLAPHSFVQAETCCVAPGPVVTLSIDSCVDDEIQPEPSREFGGHAPKDEASEARSWKRLATVELRSVADGF